MVWLLIVKLGAVQSTYMAKLAMTSWKLKTVRSISCAFPATYRVGCMTTLHSPKSKQMLGAAGGKSYTYIWWTFDFKPFLFKDHYCKEYEVWVWRHSDNYSGFWRPPFWANFNWRQKLETLRVIFRFWNFYQWNLAYWWSYSS